MTEHQAAICPECRNGKHPNCDELAIDENDELTKCQCPECAR